jgi:hypothetical protein
MKFLRNALVGLLALSILVGSAFGQELPAITITTNSASTVTYGTPTTVAYSGPITINTNVAAVVTYTGNVITITIKQESPAPNPTPVPSPSPPPGPAPKPVPPAPYVPIIVGDEWLVAVFDAKATLTPDQIALKTSKTLQLTLTSRNLCAWWSTTDNTDPNAAEFLADPLVKNQSLPVLLLITKNSAGTGVISGVLPLPDKNLEPAIVNIAERTRRKTR